MTPLDLSALRRAAEAVIEASESDDATTADVRGAIDAFLAEATAPAILALVGRVDHEATLTRSLDESLTEALDCLHDWISGDPDARAEAIGIMVKHAWYSPEKAAGLLAAPGGGGG